MLRSGTEIGTDQVNSLISRGSDFPFERSNLQNKRSNSETKASNSSRSKPTPAHLLRKNQEDCIFISDVNLTTIEEVRQTIENVYGQCQTRTKIELKAWSYHSEYSHQNGEYPLAFQDYVSNFKDEDYLKQIQLDMLDCEDLGGKEKAVKYLMKRINR